MASRDLSSIKDLLPAVLAQVARDTGRARQLKPIWVEVVGPVISRSATPYALEGTTLIISVVDAGWLAELSKRQPELLDRLKKKLGKGAITQLEFRLAG